MDAVNRCIRSDMGSAKRPDHVPLGGTGVAVFGGSEPSAEDDESGAGMIGAGMTRCVIASACRQ